MAEPMSTEDEGKLTHFAVHESDVKSSQSLFARLFQRDKGEYYSITFAIIVD